MTITIDMIKQLREATAAGMGACKEALAASNGDMDEAVKYLREKGLAVAAKRKAAVVEAEAAVKAAAPAEAPVEAPAEASAAEAAPAAPAAE